MRLGLFITSDEHIVKIEISLFMSLSRVSQKPGKKYYKWNLNNSTTENSNEKKKKKKKKQKKKKKKKKNQEKHKNRCMP